MLYWRDLIVKDVKGWKLSDEKNKAIFELSMKSHIIPTNKILKQLPFTFGTKNLKSNNSPEVIAREIIILTTSCKTQTNKVILPRIVPWYDKLNEKATRVNKHATRVKGSKEEYEVRNICFIYHWNISPKHNRRRSGLHLNYCGTRKLIENILFCLCLLDWQTSMVSMNFKVNMNDNKKK